MLEKRSSSSALSPTTHVVAEAVGSTLLAVCVAEVLSDWSDNTTDTLLSDENGVDSALENPNTEAKNTLPGHGEKEAPY